MKFVKWTDTLSIGINLIDDQHKMLITHLNELRGALDAQKGPVEVAKTLDFLIDYTRFHFDAEEKLMADHKYPDLEAHRKKHEEFKAVLANLEEDYKEEGATHSLAESFDTLLVNWLIKHICVVDIEFGVFLKNNNISLSYDLMARVEVI